MEEQTVTTCTWHPNPVALEAKDMTLRDYFATAALQGMCAGASVNCLRMPDAAMPEEIAKDAYDLADAMLIERAK